LDLQNQNQSIQLRRRPVESLAAIDVLDLDDPATVAADSVDRLDSVTPVANEPAFDKLGHGLPVFLCGLGPGIGHHLSAVQVRLVAIW